MMWCQYDVIFIARQDQQAEEGILPSRSQAREWDRIKDLRKYYYDSGFARAGPGRNPDDRILSFFVSKMGIKPSDWVRHH